MRKKAVLPDGLKCNQCANFATKTTEGKGHFLLYGCRKLKLTFGIESDWKAKKGQPRNCRQFEARMNADTSKAAKV